MFCSAAAGACRFLKWLSAQETGKGPFAGKAYSVFGLGSSCYPRFCCAADLTNSMMLQAGAVPLHGVGKGDALGGQEQSFKLWLMGVLDAVRQQVGGITAVHGPLQLQLHVGQALSQS